MVTRAYRGSPHAAAGRDASGRTRSVRPDPAIVCLDPFAASRPEIGRADIDRCACGDRIGPRSRAKRNHRFPHFAASRSRRQAPDSVQGRPAGMRVRSASQADTVNDAEPVPHQRVDSAPGQVDRTHDGAQRHAALGPGADTRTLSCAGRAEGRGAGARRVGGRPSMRSDRGSDIPASTIHTDAPAAAGLTSAG